MLDIRIRCARKSIVFFMLIYVKMPIIVGILTFMSMISFMLMYIDNDKGV